MSRFNCFRFLAILVLVLVHSQLSSGLDTAEVKPDVSQEIEEAPRDCASLAQHRPEIADQIQSNNTAHSNVSIRARAKKCLEGAKGAWADTLKALLVDPYELLAKTTVKETKNYLENCNQSLECKLALHKDAYGSEPSDKQKASLGKKLTFSEIDILNRKAISRMSSSGESDRRLIQSLKNRKWVESGGPVDQSQESETFWTTVKQNLRTYGLQLSCLTPEAASELTCYGIAMVLDPALAATAAVKTARVVRLLHPGSRVAQAKHVLGRPLIPAQVAAIEKAHLVGAGQIGADGVTPAMIGNYTKAQIADKARILKDAGFSEAERRALIESGTVGESSQTLWSKVFGGKADKKTPNALSPSGQDAAITADSIKPKFTYDKLDGPNYAWPSLQKSDVPGAKVTAFPKQSHGKDFSKIVETAEKYSGQVCSSGRVCRGMSTELQAHLKREGIETEFVSSVGHSFLRIKDYFGAGQDLIIDPTWTQFVQRQLDVFVPNPMFVGSTETLARTSEELGSIARAVKLPPNGSMNASDFMWYYQSYRPDRNR